MHTGAWKRLNASAYVGWLGLARLSVCLSYSDFVTFCIMLEAQVESQLKRTLHPLMHACIQRGLLARIPAPTPALVPAPVPVPEPTQEVADTFTHQCMHRQCCFFL
jgi:hypothetical protein